MAGQGLDPGSLALESTFFPTSSWGCLFPVLAYCTLCSKYLLGILLHQTESSCGSQEMKRPALAQHTVECLLKDKAMQTHGTGSTTKDKNSQNLRVWRGFKWDQVQWPAYCPILHRATLQGVHTAHYTSAWRWHSGSVTWCLTKMCPPGHQATQSWSNSSCRYWIEIGFFRYWRQPSLWLSLWQVNPPLFYLGIWLSSPPWTSPLGTCSGQPGPCPRYRYPV